MAMTRRDFDTIAAGLLNRRAGPAMVAVIADVIRPTTANFNATKFIAASLKNIRARHEAFVLYEEMQRGRAA